MNIVRLACVKHAASVRPEPGSNSQIKFIACLCLQTCFFTCLFDRELEKSFIDFCSHFITLYVYCSFFKDRFALLFMSDFDILTCFTSLCQAYFSFFSCLTQPLYCITRNSVVSMLLPCSKRRIHIFSRVLLIYCFLSLHRHCFLLSFLQYQLYNHLHRSVSK